MKYCPRCGAQLSDDAAFCSNCGTPFEAQQTQYQYPPQYQQAPQYQQQAPVSNGKATGSMVCGIISLFVAGLILGIIAIVLANKSKQEVGYLLPQAKAGRICGIIALIFVGIAAIVGAILGATGAFSGLFSGIRYYY